MVGLLNARSHLFPLVFLFDMLLLSLILCFFLSNLSLFFLLKSDLIKISFPLPLKSPSILSRLAEPFPVRRSSKGLRSCNIFTVPAYYLASSITKQARGTREGVPISETIVLRGAIKRQKLVFFGHCPNERDPPAPPYQFGHPKFFC